MTPGIQQRTQGQEANESGNSTNNNHNNRNRNNNSTESTPPRLSPTPLCAHATSPKSADVVSLSQLAEAELELLYEASFAVAAASTAAAGSAVEGSSTTTTTTTATTTIMTVEPLDTRQSFPAACRAMLLELEGNSRCVDCGNQNPEWAAVSYGAMVCLQCAGIHRSMGVNVSTVRSVTMDHWRYDEVVKMLEGGNRQLSSFFQRHNLHRDCVEFQSPHLTSANVATMRYKTKAALFYRQQLDQHVQQLLTQGPYQGRKRRTKRRPLGTQKSNLA